MYHFTLKTQVKEVLNPQQVSKMFSLDFIERASEEKLLSIEDHKFLKMVKDGIYQQDDGHFDMPLPLKRENLQLPNNN